MHEDDPVHPVIVRKQVGIHYHRHRNIVQNVDQEVHRYRRNGTEIDLYRRHQDQQNMIAHDDITGNLISQKIRPTK